MNVKLLKQVRDYIKAHPDNYNQGAYCGSACCVAGHAALLSGIVQRKYITDRSSDTSIIKTVAQIALGLDGVEANRLFHPTWSDTKFYVNGSMAPDKRSAIAVKRINHFIRTKGAE